MEILGSEKKIFYMRWPPRVVFDLCPNEVFFFIEKYHRLVGKLGEMGLEENVIDSAWFLRYILLANKFTIFGPEKF